MQIPAKSTKFVVLSPLNIYILKHQVSKQTFQQMSFQINKCHLSIKIPACFKSGF